MSDRDPLARFEEDLSATILAAEDVDPDVLPPISTTKKVGMSLRLDPDVMKELLDRAGERGVGHTVLAADMIAAGLAAMREQVMVPLADVQLAVAQLAARRPPAA